MEKCFLCNRSCDNNNLNKHYIKKTFTNFDIVKNPLSDYICDDCKWSLQSNENIKLIDGEKRTGAVRNYSWIITKNKKIASTIRHNRARQFV